MGSADYINKFYFFLFFFYYQFRNKNN